MTPEDLKRYSCVYKNVDSVFICNLSISERFAKHRPYEQVVSAKPLRRQCLYVGNNGHFRSCTEVRISANSSQTRRSQYQIQYSSGRRAQSLPSPYPSSPYPSSSEPALLLSSSSSPAPAPASSSLYGMGSIGSVEP